MAWPTNKDEYGTREYRREADLWNAEQKRVRRNRDRTWFREFVPQFERQYERAPDGSSWVLISEVMRACPIAPQQRRRGYDLTVSAIRVRAWLMELGYEVREVLVPQGRDRVTGASVRPLPRRAVIGLRLRTVVPEDGRV